MSNKKESFLAIDIGASSGRHIIGYKENDKLIIKEIYRFENNVELIDNQFCWNMEKIFNHVKEGIKKTISQGYKPQSLSIDTWAVDYVLLDKDDKPIGKTLAYRDSRTNNAVDDYYKTRSKNHVYNTTGIQFQQFNTLYQLFVTQQDVKEKAETLLLIPDYLIFLLTGVKACEYTNASTTQLLNLNTNDWDKELIASTGLKASAFLEISTPKTKIGGLKKELVEDLGCDINVVLCGSHDTASAFVASPNITGNSINLSSGTWSLIGIENTDFNNSHESMDLNFTNEGGIDYRYRYLKNIMGLWLIQEVKRNLNNEYSFAQLVQEAIKADDFHSIIKVNEKRFYKPKSMIEEIKTYCKETNQRIPETIGEISKCVFISLAECYKNAVEQIEQLTKTTYDELIIFGGGCQNEYLNQLISNLLKKTVRAGPFEATAIGNILVQMIANGNLKNLTNARQLVIDSFDIKVLHNIS